MSDNLQNAPENLPAKPADNELIDARKNTKWHDPQELLALAGGKIGGTLGEKMGIEFVKLDAQELIATMPVAGNTQPYGLLHGGASVVLAETLGSIGSMLTAGPGKIAVGVDINATHHRGVRDGIVTGIAKPVHQGRSSACYEVVITNEAGQRICTSRITCMIIDDRK